MRIKVLMALAILSAAVSPLQAQGGNTLPIKADTIRCPCTITKKAAVPIRRPAVRKAAAVRKVDTMFVKSKAGVDSLMIVEKLDVRFDNPLHVVIDNPMFINPSAVTAPVPTSSSPSEVMLVETHHGWFRRNAGWVVPTGLVAIGAGIWCGVSHCFGGRPINIHTVTTVNVH